MKKNEIPLFLFDSNENSWDLKNFYFHNFILILHLVYLRHKSYAIKAETGHTLSINCNYLAM